MSQCTKADALKTQVAGNHYSKLKIQPMEFAMANSWDAGAFSILKYVTRHHDKNGLQDLQKARHFVDLRDALMHGRFKVNETVTMRDYCHANGLSVADTVVLCALDGWVWNNSTRAKLELVVAIERLVEDCYGTPNI